MKTLHLLWMTCLLATSVITAQNNSEEAIKKSKATIDSIVSSEKETLKKKLSYNPQNEMYQFSKQNVHFLSGG